MSNDYTSLLSVGVLSGTEIDEMGGDIVGGEGGWDPFPEPGDPAVTIYDIPGKEQFWNMTYTGSALPDTATQVFSADLSVGLLIQRKADFVFEGEPGLQFTRVSRNQDDRSRAFGIGGSHSFDIFLDGQMGTAVDLIMEDGGSVHFKHQQPRAGQSGDTYEAERGSYRFNGTQAVYAGGLWQIKTTDGWTYNFPYRPKALGQYVTVLTGFTDPTGHKYEMERDAFGALVAVTSSSGKWLHFENDSAHRIRKVTSSLGRSVQYEYDTGGRMVRATDSEGRVDSYTYGEKAQMFTAGHGTGKPILTNEYYSEDNYIKSQIMSDGRKFGYHYARGQANVIRESQIIDPNRLETYIQYGRGGYLQSLPTPLPQ
jgi:YD repeat-containing protein